MSLWSGYPTEDKSTEIHCLGLKALLLVIKRIVLVQFKAFNRPKDSKDAKTFKKINFEVQERCVIFRFYQTQQTTSLRKKYVISNYLSASQKQNSKLIREVIFWNDSNRIYSVSECYRISLLNEHVLLYISHRKNINFTLKYIIIF